MPVDQYQIINYTQEEILDMVAKTWLVGPQYYTPHYSNLGIAVLGRALEAAVGVSYEDFVNLAM